jgi:hypothetical protein
LFILILSIGKFFKLFTLKKYDVFFHSLELAGKYFVSPIVFLLTKKGVNLNLLLFINLEKIKLLFNLCKKLLFRLFIINIHNKQSWVLIKDYCG